MMVMVRRGLLALFVCVHCLVVAAREEDTLAFHLSRVFSEVSRTNDNAVALRVIEGTVGFFVRAAGDEQGHVRTVRGGEVLRLALGGWYRLGVPRSASSLTVALTNEVPELAESVGGAVRGSRVEGPFLFVQRRTYEGTHGDAQVRDRCFAVDVADGRFFDYEKRARGRLEMPFRSLWTDWDDYLKNFSGKTVGDGLALIRTVAQTERDGLVGDTQEGASFRAFCQEMTNAVPQVVLYRRRRSGGDGSSCRLALVRVRESLVQVLGTATFYPESTTLHDRVSIFDAEGCLVWSCSFRKKRGRPGAETWLGDIYQFDREGGILRFVELDAEGRELPRSVRTLKDRAMVEPVGRADFLAEMQNAIRPLTEAWRKQAYVELPARTVTAVSPGRNTPTWLLDYEKRRQGAIDEANRSRRAAGRPAFTREEEELILREARFERSRLWFEKIRHEMTGRRVTTDEDRMFDRERVRLNDLRRTLERCFAPRGYPATLQELVGRKDSRFGQLLLPGGEGDFHDQWGRAYHYEVVRMANQERDRPILISSGPDGVLGNADDLSSEDWFVYRKYESENREKSVQTFQGPSNPDNQQPPLP